MQSKTLLQPFAPTTDYTPTQSKAESEASQREHLKPSECKVGDVFYRYEGVLTSSGVDQFDDPIGPGYMAVNCYRYDVIKVTPKGARISAFGLEGSKPIYDSTINKFAYPSKAEALLGFIARKRRQQSILNSQLAHSKEAQYKAEQLLAKEMQC